MIEVRSLTRRFGDAVAVDGASFAVARGEVVGFLGPNGAGKTTTMRVLTGYLSADAGSATVAGYDVGRDSRAVRRAVGYLPENAPLYLDMLVIDQLEWVARLRDIPRPERPGRIQRALDRCGLGSVLGRSIGTLSKGYRQRVGLALALVHEPDILILDEPSSGLDPNQIVEIRGLIRDLGRDRTVLLSTHTLSEVEATCDRVVIIDAGKVVASGTPAALAAERGGRWALSVRGPRAAVVSAVAALGGVEVTGDDGEVCALRVTTTGAGDDVAEALFRAVADGGWALRELRREGGGLEHVFRALTAGGREATS